MSFWVAFGQPGVETGLVEAKRIVSSASYLAVGNSGCASLDGNVCSK